MDVCCLAWIRVRIGLYRGATSLHLYRGTILNATPASCGKNAARRPSLLLKKAERRYQLETRDYARLAAFRHALRRFLRFSEAAAARVGLTTQHYQAMLVLRGCPDDKRVTINDLAQPTSLKQKHTGVAVQPAAPAGPAA